MYLPYYWLVLSIACSVILFVSEPLTIQKANWLLQLIEKVSYDMCHFISIKCYKLDVSTCEM